MYDHFNTTHLNTTISRVRFRLQSLGSVLAGLVPVKDDNAGVSFFEPPTIRNRFGFPIVHCLAS